MTTIGLVTNFSTCFKGFSSFGLAGGSVTNSAGTGDIGGVEGGVSMSNSVSVLDVVGEKLNLSKKLQRFRSNSGGLTTSFCPFFFS